MNGIRVAALDMNNGEANLGFASILTILSRFPEFEVTQFDVRAKGEVPGIDFDIYVSSGGPGSPVSNGGKHTISYFNLIDRIWDWNQNTEKPKYCFFVCHSFQMLCGHWQLGAVVPRKSEAFGVFPIHKTAAGRRDPLFEGLGDPFYAADFRQWQVIQPDNAKLKKAGMSILALEKIRPHIDLERAVMAIRFSPWWVGVQFHPEAEPGGMFRYFSDEKRKHQVIEERGARKYAQMIGFAKDPQKLRMTYNHVLPRFLHRAKETLCALEMVT